MQARLRSVGGVDVLELAGKITIGEGDAELRQIAAELIGGGHSRLLISLEKVGFMDSAGLGELVACFKKAAEKGGAVKLLRPSGKVADLLSLTKITDIFEIYQDEGDAIASF
jgi:anti-sigma B factor antagonist